MIKNIKEFDISKRGVLKKESIVKGDLWSGFSTTILGGGGINLKSANYNITSYDNSTQFTGNKVFKIRNDKQTLTDYKGESFHGAVITTIDNKFDSYNEIVQKTTKHFYKSPIHGIENRLEKTEKLDFKYSNDNTETNYHRGRLLEIKKTESIPGEKDFIAEDFFTYNLKGQIIQVKKKADNSLIVTEENNYDIDGNIVEKNILGENMAPRTTKFAYDSTGRYLISSTDIEGLVTKFKYNTAKGLLIEEESPEGFLTKYTYNNWGQEISRIDFLGKTSSLAYFKNGKNVEIISTDEQGTWIKNYYDVFGNIYKTSLKNIQGEIVSKQFKYDALNRIVAQSDGYIGTNPTAWTTTEYDILGRVKNIKESRGKETVFSYKFFETTIQDQIKKTVTIQNSLGQVVSRIDPGGEILYKYFSNGGLKSSNYGGVIVALELDAWGRRKKLVDPSAGTYLYEYNALGELIQETTPKGYTKYTLDEVGRISKKIIKGDHTDNEVNYTYDSETRLLTSSAVKINEDNYSYNYTYDTFNRLIHTRETTPYVTFSKAVAFDEFGRVEKEIFTANAYGKISEKQIRNTYKNGYHWKVIDELSNKILSTKGSTDGHGNLVNYVLGNGLEVVNTYDSFGFLVQNTAKHNNTELFKLTNTFNARTGNLTSRYNGMFKRLEHFEYDELDRLVSFTNKEGLVERQSYDERGRVTENNVGTYSYIDPISYQIGEIELNSNSQTYYNLRPEQRISYNAFKSPVWIKEKNKENIYFDYNVNNQRATMFYGNLAEDKAQSNKRRHYSLDGSMEVSYDVGTNVVDFTTFIDGDAYSASIIAKGTTSQHYYYLHRDYLGSVIAITDKGARIVEKRCFDAWGNVVLVQDGAGNNLDKLTFFDRGYTGHEHLQDVGLIHMNGRLYDPVIKRFLSPDNFVQNILETQDFNRYGYVLNNPLKYTDASGEFWHVVIGAVIGGLVNWGIHGFRFDAEGLKAFGVGALAGAVGAATGGVAFTALGGGAAGAGGFLAVAGGGMFGSAFSTATLSLGNHVLLGDKMMSGKEVLISIAIGGILGGVGNGSVALLNGKNFWNGANPVAKVLPVTIQPYGIQGVEPNIDLTSSTVIKAQPDLATVNAVKNIKDGATNNIVTTFGPDGNKVVNFNGALDAVDSGKPILNAAKEGVRYSDDLINAAQEAYPKLAGKTQLHQITPKYLGGPVNGPLIKLDAAYHQQITNAFRAEWGYGIGKPSAAQLDAIMKRVYSRFPLPK